MLIETTEAVPASAWVAAQCFEAAGQEFARRIEAAIECVRQAFRDMTNAMRDTRVVMEELRPIIRTVVDDYVRMLAVRKQQSWFRDLEPARRRYVNNAQTVQVMQRPRRRQQHDIAQARQQKRRMFVQALRVIA